MKQGFEIQKLLLIKMSAVGDVVMTLPALAALKERFPEAVVDWLVEPAAAGLLAGHPALNRVLVSPRPVAMSLAARGCFILAKRLFDKFRQELRQTDYDVVLDLQGLFKSGLLAGLARGRRKVGFAPAREWAHLFLNEKLPPYDPERHAVPATWMQPSTSGPTRRSRPTLITAPRLRPGPGRKTSWDRTREKT